jgi:hypothetical protein
MMPVTRSSSPSAPDGRRPARPVRAFFLVLGTVFLGPDAVDLVIPVLPWVPPEGAIAPRRIVG